jgi:hypothetical protein
MTNETRVRCHKCGRSGLVNTARSLEIGWPRCCQKEMSPVEPQIEIKSAFQRSEEQTV